MSSRPDSVGSCTCCSFVGCKSGNAHRGLSYKANDGMPEVLKFTHALTVALQRE